MKKKHTKRRQPRIAGLRRNPLFSCVDPRILNAVIRDSIRWDASPSWIIATALAAFYSVDIVTPMGEPMVRKVSRKKYQLSVH